MVPSFDTALIMFNQAITKLPDVPHTSLPSCSLRKDSTCAIHDYREILVAKRSDRMFAAVPKYTSITTNSFNPFELPSKYYGSKGSILSHFPVTGSKMVPGLQTGSLSIGTQPSPRTNSWCLRLGFG
jgi:hypothetical protein